MDLQLTSLRADETRRYPISGMRVNGHKEDLALIVRWTGASKEYQDAVANESFRKLKDGEQNAALPRILAEHIVVGWDNVPVIDGKPIEYTAARGAQVLARFYADGRLDLAARFLAFVGNGDHFQRAIVDAVDLGNA